MSKRGLGMGLDALIQSTASAAASGHQEPSHEVPVAMITPNKFQPRRVFDEDALAELCQSIKQYGIVQPVVVRRIMQGYELVAGERRWRAAQMAGLKTVPAVIREYTDAEMTEIALIENLQRADLNPIEEGQAYKRLMEEFGLTQEEVSRKIGRSRSHIANMIRMLNLPATVQSYVSRGTLSMGQARPILTLGSEELQLEAAETIMAEDLSARDAEELVRRLSTAPRVKKPTPSEKTEIYVAEAEDTLRQLLGTQVRIKPGKMKSRIEIEYYTDEDLERIIESLSSPRREASVGRTTLVV